MRNRFARVLVLIFTVTIAQFGRTDETRGRPGPELIAHGTSVLERLKKGDYASIIAEMHYPASYTEDEIDEDRKALGAGFSFLMTELGSLESFAPQIERVEFYTLGMGAGSVDYWSKLPNLGISAALTFRTRHANLDFGLVRITYCRFQAMRFIRSVDFGIPVAQAGAREFAGSLGQRLFEAMKAAGNSKDRDSAI